jgi:hypothetical protein
VTLYKLRTNSNRTIIGLHRSVILWNSENTSSVELWESQSLWEATRHGLWLNHPCLYISSFSRQDMEKVADLWGDEIEAKASLCNSHEPCQISMRGKLNKPTRSGFDPFISLTLTMPLGYPPGQTPWTIRN